MGALSDKIQELEERVATAEAKLRAIEERTEAENTAPLHPDKGHGGPKRYAD